MLALVLEDFLQAVWLMHPFKVSGSLASLFLSLRIFMEFSREFVFFTKAEACKAVIL